MTGQNASVLHIKRPRLRDEITHGEITENVTNPNTSLSSSLKSQGLQISPMHSIHLWINPPPSELGPPEEQWPRQYCALLQSLPTAKGRLQPGRIAPTTIIHGTSLPLPTALQTQALAFSHHTRCTHTHTHQPTQGSCVLATQQVHISTRAEESTSATARAGSMPARHCPEVQALNQVKKCWYISAGQSHSYNFTTETSSELCSLHTAMSFPTLSHCLWNIACLNFESNNAACTSTVCYTYSRTVPLITEGQQWGCVQRPKGI